MYLIKNLPKYKFSSQFSAISPLDGRYNSKVNELSKFFSEQALMKYRIKVEIKWLQFLLQRNMVKSQKGSKVTVNPLELAKLDAIYQQFDLEGAKRVKEIEDVTNHDVKSVEYYIKEKLDQNNLFHESREYVHFCCTSEDINNLAYSLMVKDAFQKVLIKNIEDLIKKLSSMAHTFHDVPMLSRTHGQAATPTTVGKELANFSYRINNQFQQMQKVNLAGKLNGAVGNFNAHIFTYPEYDWPQLSKEFITQLGLEFNPYTTQIEPHDQLAVFYQYLFLINTILKGFSQDMWHYISIGYYKQKPKAGEVGSSTMPHKVNPIDFENCEGNLGMANSIITHLIEKLPISRYQRDLTDSTVMRNNGIAFGYSVLAYKSLLRGLNKIDVNEQKLNQDLESHWEILAEPIQMIMRKHGKDNPYELLKEKTRGQQVTKQMIQELVQEIQLPQDEKKRLSQLTPQNYLGNAAQMAKIKF